MSEFICPFCNRDCRTALGLRSHMQAAHKGHKSKEVDDSMEEARIREIASEIIETRMELDKLKAENSFLKRQLEEKETMAKEISQARSQVLQAQKDREKLEKELEAFKEKVGNHEAMWTEVVSCPTCKSGLMRRIVKMVCTDEACKRQVLSEICLTDLEAEIERRKRPTLRLGERLIEMAGKKERKSSFTVGLPQG